MTCFMVYVQGRDAPRVMHPSLDAAVAEAERLAKGNLGRQVLVVQVLRAMRGEAQVVEVPLPAASPGKTAFEPLAWPSAGTSGMEVR